jgi:hypothetical protein
VTETRRRQSRPEIVPLTGDRSTFVGIGVAGFRELVAWVIAAPTAEQREQRGELAKECVAEALSAVDHDHVNARIRTALRFDPFATSKSATATWRN